MRIAGHPVHVMLVHFPVALWPAHAVFHLLAPWLPAGVAGAGGFWLLAGGTAIGWVAMMAGSLDWLEISRGDNAQKLRDATWHAAINGLALGGFTVLAVREWESYPAIVPEGRALVAEGVLIALLFVGNYFGGQVVWRGRFPPGRRTSQGVADADD